LTFARPSKSKSKSIKREDGSGKDKKKHVHRIGYEDDFDIQSYRGYKVKKEFESVVNDEIKKVEEESEGQKKFNRDNSDDSEDEEEVIILKHKPDFFDCDQYSHSARCSSS
jgi:hypothetical protein